MDATSYLVDAMKLSVKTNRHLRGDLLLVAVLAVLVLLGALYLFVLRGGGNVVTVTVDGKVHGEYSLLQDRVEEIYTDDGGHNRLVISGGKAFVETATCPDKICVGHRPIFRDGESIICLPNRVVITVVAQKTADSPDAVA